nr:hypothetical protein OH826_26330 [Streptomyces sp. NBC_00899]
MTEESDGGMAAVRWGLIIDEMRPMREHHEPRVLEEFAGTRQEALARLGQLVDEYVAYNPYDTARIRIYRTADGFLHVRDRGGMWSQGIRFWVGELVSDTNDAKEAAAAEKRAAKEAKAAERRARRERRRMPVEDDIEEDVQDGAEDVGGG